MDCGCTKTVCGEIWLKCYLESLTKVELYRVFEEKTSSKFKFGDNKLIKSNRRVKIPAVIANRHVIVTTEVIDYDIPLLLSNQSMKKASTKIDFKLDTLTMYGKSVKLSFTSSGHYCITLNDCTENVVMYS